MDALCPLGFLQKTDSIYNLTPVSETYLVRGKETFYGDWTLKTQIAWQIRNQSTTAIKTGHAIGGDFSEPDKEDDWVMGYSRAILNWRKGAKDALERWQKLGVNKKNYHSPNILDIACGSGIKSLAIAKENRNATVTLLDSPKMLELACRVADRMGVRDQVELSPGNLPKLEIEKGKYDIIHCGLILYYFRGQNLLNILRNAYDGLKPDGILVINEYLADENRSENEIALLVAYQLLLFAPDSQVRSFSDYKKILEGFGYTEITFHDGALLTARKQKL